MGICIIQTACFSLTCVLFEKEKLKYMGYNMGAIMVGEMLGPFIGSILFKELGYLN